MQFRFSKNILNTPKSFIREILKVTTRPDIISFAGGLPNGDLFPIQEIKEASDHVLTEKGRTALQYSTSEGCVALREIIAARYSKNGLKIPVEDILIVSGSQQALDLTGRCFLDYQDPVLIERPGYLGAIQAFSLYSPVFHEVELENDGLNINELEKQLKKTNAKLLYTTPNFQNPTGLTYSLEKRRKVGELISKSQTMLVEDDPYGDLRFIGDNLPPMKTFAGDNCVLLGSFSKIITPGFRIGWICAAPAVMDKLVTAKQGSDLHTNTYAQEVLARYMRDNDIDTHIAKIRKAYYSQREAMVKAIKLYLPEGVSYTEPEGGMFVWVTLPAQYNTMELFNYAIKHGVAFVPGNPFYADAHASNSMRLNYTSCDEATITRGIKQLGEAINEYLASEVKKQ